MHQLITKNPEPLDDLTVGTRYSYKNEALHEMKFRIASAPPTDESGARTVHPRGHILSVGAFSVKDGENAYIWSPTATGVGEFIYNEDV